MLQPTTIKKQPFKHPSLDYNFLRELGIEATQRLSGQIWTDYNTHDPGVTILEQLCFAITDLSYRTDFPIHELINSKSNSLDEELKDTFFDASEILPTNPLTVDDYRMLIIDRIKAVKNAWFEPVRDNLQGIQGLYRVLLQVEDNARQPENLLTIKQQVTELFNAHRNMAEDIESIEILDVEHIVVYADIEIGSEFIAEEILATIQFQVNEYLNPTIRFYTFEELQEEGYTIDQAFNGPMPLHGFIKKENLLPMRQEVYVSKIMEIITAVEGVRRINFFSVEKNDISIEGDVIQIEKGFYPILDMDTINDKYTPSTYPIQFFRGSLNYDLDLHTANQLLYSLFARYKKGYNPKMIYNPNKYPSRFKQQDLASYFSVQHAFPITYGLNAFGLPHWVQPTRERLAMVKQLRGYLINFEQILANYLAQLANVKQLFAIDSRVTQTYFSQVTTDIPLVYEILDVPTTSASTVQKFGSNTQNINDVATAAFAPKLNALTRKFDPFIERRNRFLDHLLARFGEQFSTDFLLKVSAGYGNYSGTADPEIDLINAKIHFMQNYVDISRNRSKGFNYLSADGEAWNVSGLEKRICLLLNIPNNSSDTLLQIFQNKVESIKVQPFSNVIDFISPTSHHSDLLQPNSAAAKELAADLELEVLDEETPEEKKRRESLEKIDDLIFGGTEEDRALFDRPTDDFLSDSELPTDGDADDNFTAPTDIADSVAVDYTQKFIFRSNSRSELLSELLSDGIFYFNYLVLADEDKNIYIYYKGNKNIGAYKIRQATSRLQAKELILELIAYFENINKYSEGLHLVEHILLRAQSKDQHYFVLKSDREEILLMSYELGDLQEQRYTSEEIPNLGAKIANYEIQKIAPVLAPKQENNQEENPSENIEPTNTAETELTENAEYVIILKNVYGKPVAKVPKVYTDLKAAEFKVRDIADYINSFLKTGISIFNQIQFEMQKKLVSDVDDKFYSQEISVIMPNWTTRFQNADFRLLVKNTFMVNTPAHLHVNFYWIGIEEMEDFERSQSEWFYERLTAVPQQPNLDEKALALTKLLTNYQSIVEKRRKKRRN
jgi:hypothetical protein